MSGGSVGSGLGGSGSPCTPTRAPGPAAADHCSSTKGQAPRRPPFPLRSSGRCQPRPPPPPTHTPASESREGGRGSAAPHSGPCAPAQVGGRGLVGACPTRSGLEEARLDLRRRRHLAAYSENTPSHPQPWGVSTRLPSTVPSPTRAQASPTRAQASPERGSVLPNLPSESFAKREVIDREAAPEPPKVTGVSWSKLTGQAYTSLTADNIPLSSQGQGYSHPLANNTVLTPTRSFPHSVSHSHNHTVCLVHHKVPCPFFP